MIRQPVNSSDISSMGYDEAAQTLEIEFQSGGVYQYFGVPHKVFSEMINSVSCGKYFHSNIKDVYSGQRISK